jgi:hypothetical protein
MATSGSSSSRGSSASSAFHACAPWRATVPHSTQRSASSCSSTTIGSYPVRVGGGRRRSRHARSSASSTDARPRERASCPSVCDASSRCFPRSATTAANASADSSSPIPFASSTKRACQRAAARGQRSGSASAISRARVRASARVSRPSSRAASSAWKSCRRRIARWNRPYALPCDVISICRWGDGVGWSVRTRLPS